MSKSDAFNALVDETAKEYGRLDVLVNNAGVAVSPDKGSERPIWEHTDAGYDLAMNVNARGVFNGTRAATKVMIEQEPWPSEDRGWIINISSIYGLRPFPKISECRKYRSPSVDVAPVLTKQPHMPHQSMHALLLHRLPLSTPLHTGSMSMRFVLAVGLDQPMRASCVHKAVKYFTDISRRFDATLGARLGEQG